MQKKLRKCECCEYLFDTADVLRSHAERCQHRKNMFRCKMCKETFDKLEKRDQHFPEVRKYIHRESVIKILVSENDEHIDTMMCYYVFSVFYAVAQQKEKASSGVKSQTVPMRLSKM